MIEAIEHPEQDPAEGSREVIERDLERQGGKRSDGHTDQKKENDPGARAAEPSSE